MCRRAVRILNLSLKPLNPKHPSALRLAWASGRHDFNSCLYGYQGLHYSVRSYPSCGYGCLEEDEDLTWFNHPKTPSFDPGLVACFRHQGEGHVGMRARM